MAEFPAMPFWFDAYWLDCSHLSDAEHGRYLLVMMQLWTAPKQRIPNDDEWLARRFRRSVDAVRAEIRPILQEFCKCDGNWWIQKRLSEEFAYVHGKRQKRSDAAKSLWERKKGACNADAPTPTPTIETLTYLPNLDSEPSKSETRTVPSASEGTAGEGQAGTDLLCEQTGCDKPKRKRNDYPEGFERFWAIYPKRSTDTKAAAFKAWDKQRKAGTDLSELQAGAERYADYAARTGCETAHVQTWINRQGWTASYAIKGNGHANRTAGHRPSAIQEFWRRHGRDAGPAGGGADSPVAEDEAPRRG